MKYLITIVLVLSLNLIGKSDDTSCKEMEHQQRVISKNGLKLRIEPTQESQSLCIVPYWEKVSVCWVNQGTDTISNVAGHWKKVKYNDIQGYLFDGFLVQTDTIYEHPNDFRFFMEGNRCAFPNFDPTLNWYGVYETEHGDSLIKVEITIRKPKINENIDFPWSLIFETNLSKNKKSKLLIGSRKPLQEKLLNYKPIEESIFLYPGQEYTIWGGKNETKIFDYIKLTAIGNVTKNIYSPEFDYYGLQLVKMYNNIKYQDISKYFDFPGSFPCMQNLYWFGDIDGDYQVDLIFLSCGNSMTKYTLLLSSISENKEFVKKADEWFDYNCN